MEATAAAVLLAGLRLLARRDRPGAARPAARRGASPALAPALIVGVWLGATGLVALFAHHIVRRANVALTWPRGALVLAVLVAWLAVTVVCVAGCAASAALALRRATARGHRPCRFHRRRRRSPPSGSPRRPRPAVVCLVSLLRCPDGGLDPRDAVFSAGSVVVVVTVTSIAAVSVVARPRGVALGTTGAAHHHHLSAEHGDYGGATMVEGA